MFPRRKSYRISNSSASNMQLLLSGLEAGSFRYLRDYPKSQFGSHRSQEEARAFQTKAQEYRNKVLSIYGDGLAAEYVLLKEAALWTCQAILDLKAEKKKTLFGYMEKALFEHLANIAVELTAKQCDSLELVLNCMKELPDEYAGFLMVETPRPY